MDATLIVVCMIVRQLLHGPTAMDHMGCTVPMPAADAKALIANTAGAFDRIPYTLQEHKEPLSPDPKPVGELSVNGNPELGRVRVHWDSATGGADIWSPAIPENKAVAAIEYYAREDPVRFTNPAAYDLVKAN